MRERTELVSFVEDNKDLKPLAIIEKIFDICLEDYESIIIKWEKKGKEARKKGEKMYVEDMKNLDIIHGRMEILSLFLEDWITIKPTIIESITKLFKKL
jgi:hypothetical protein